METGQSNGGFRKDESPMECLLLNTQTTSLVYDLMDVIRHQALLVEDHVPFGPGMKAVFMAAAKHFHALYGKESLLFEGINSCFHGSEHYCALSIQIFYNYSSGSSLVGICVTTRNETFAICLPLRLCTHNEFKTEGIRPKLMALVSDFDEVANLLEAIRGNVIFTLGDEYDEDILGQVCLN